MNNQVIVVDLDGTILNTDTLHECVFHLLSNAPLELLKIPFHLLKGKAYLKKRLAEKTDLNLDLLPWNKELIKILTDKKNEGAHLVLCSGADMRIANSISLHLGIFDEVFASDGKNNLIGKSKADLLIKKFGKKNFDYAGNSNVDISVWKFCKSALVINGTKKLSRSVERITDISYEQIKNRFNIKIFLKAIRIHQWLKNLLLFVPMVAAHLTHDLYNWFLVSIGFVSFSLLASSIYLLNDLLDLDNDRSHQRKKTRPFASGDISLAHGAALIPILMSISFYLAFSMLNETFIFWLTIYLILTIAYSFVLKPIILIDVITLSLLYTIRVIAGGAVISLGTSPWLLAFSIFLFVSLAFIKRYSELDNNKSDIGSKIMGRGYYSSDIPIIQSLGISSAFCAVLVFALYINSPEIIVLYDFIQIIWLCIPVLIFWLSWMWICTNRGQMHDDPIMFAFKDKYSVLSGIAFILIIILGG